MLRAGADAFGVDVADEKRRRVEDCIRNYLAMHPGHGLRTSGRPFRHYPVTDTPFTIVYEFDVEELRVLFILHNRADRRKLRTSSVEW